MHLVKHLLAVLIILLGSTNLTAQEKQETIITEQEVSRILKTLSSDEMQGRKVFTPGSDKASAFIEQEFKKIGLQYYPGLQSYRQPFVVYQMLPVSRQATINGKKLTSDAIAVAPNGAFEKLEWRSNQSHKLHLIQISATADFIAITDSIMQHQKMYDGLINQQQDLLILVDKAHKANFNRKKSFIERRAGNKIQKRISSILFVLTDQLKVSDYHIVVTNSIKTAIANNVIGILPGKSKAKEQVLFSAHYDHLGFIKPSNNDSIANGADDDASGTTAVITLANYFKKAKAHERTLVFIAFTFEEGGGYGSQYFSTKTDPSNIVAMFNIEMIGKLSPFGVRTGYITGFDQTDFGKIIQKNTESSNYTFHPDPFTDENLFFRSDNIRLARLGVPAHSLSTDKIDTDKLYHSVDDEFESIDIPNMTATIQAIAVGARSIVEGTDTPTRVIMKQ